MQICKVALNYPRELESTYRETGQSTTVTRASSLQVSVWANFWHIRGSCRYWELPQFQSKVDVFHSAVAMYYAPSDNAGIRGMHKERICSNPSWYGHPRYDTITVVLDDTAPSFQSMSAARVLLLFSFTHEGFVYPCALVLTLAWYLVWAGLGCKNGYVACTAWLS